jgi:hypothetical protein
MGSISSLGQIGYPVHVLLPVMKFGGSLIIFELQ